MKRSDGESLETCPYPKTAPCLHEKVLTLLLEEKPGRVLDVPAGEGAFAARACRLGYKVSCGDIDSSQFKVGGVECAQFDMNESWPWEDCTFDYVVSIEGLEHLENPWHLIREANRVLRINGKFFISTPNILSIRSRMSYLLYGYPNYFHYMIALDHQKRELPIEHVNPLGFLELRHILSLNGFQIELIDTNRYLKRHSLLYQLLRTLMHIRGRSHTRIDPAKAMVRKYLLSPPLLFGEILVVKSKKVAI